MKIFIKLSVVFIFIVFSSQSAIGYTPNGAHPRIWINSSVKSKLLTKVSNNTPEWQQLKSWCDSNIGAKLTSGYQGNNWYEYVLNYGACYQVTGNQTYGNEGVIYLKALLNDKLSIGDGLGGATAIQVDSGYVARTFGAGLALGRDWLDGASTLDAQTISSINTRLAEWITWFSNSGYSNNNPADNYFAGYFAMVYSAAIGLYGDSGYNSTWLTQANSMWNGSVLPLINGDLKGGDWFEGWNYGPWAAREYLQYPYAVETGAGDSSVWLDTAWYSELVKSHIYMLHPSKKYTSDDGVWSGDAGSKGYPSSGALIAYLAEAAPISATLKGMARWYENNLLNEQGAPRRFEKFLWYNQSDTRILPTATALGGLAYNMSNGHTLSRSDEWSNNLATYVDFIGTANNRGQAQKNVGEFKISSRGEKLLVDSDTYQDSSAYANVPEITGSHTYAPYQEDWHTPVSYLYGHQDNLYTYLKVTNIKNAYDGVQNNNPSASYYDRQTLFLPPDLVVNFDNITVVDPTVNKVTLNWHFNGNPSLGINNAFVISNTAKLYMTTLGQPITLAKALTNAGATGVYKVAVKPVDNSKSNQLFTIFETADFSSISSSNVTLINSSDSKMKGIFIQAPLNKHWLVLFSADQYGNDVSGNITYTIPFPTVGKALWHLILNLPSNTTYTVVPPIDGTVAQTYQLLVGSDTAKGVVYKSSSQGVISFLAGAPPVTSRPPVPPTGAVEDK